MKTHKVMVIASSGEIGGAPAKNLIFCISLYNSAPAQFLKCRKDAQERFIQKTNPQYSSSMSLTQPFYHSLDHRSGYPNSPLSLPRHFHSADITLCLSFPIQANDTAVIPIRFGELCTIASRLSPLWEWCQCIVTQRLPC